MNIKIKNTLKIAVIMLLVVSVQSCFSQPQRGQGGPPAPDKEQIEDMVNKLTKELELNDEQVSQITKKYNAHFDEVEKMMEDGRPERSVMEKMKSDLETDVKSVLTEDQKKQFEKLMKQEQRRPRR